jgi:hypothetical protein
MITMGRYLNARALLKCEFLGKILTTALKKYYGPGMVTQTYNLSYLGGRDLEDRGSRSAREQKVQEDSNKIKGNLISKITITERVTRCAQVVECLISKQGILS